MGIRNKYLPIRGVTDSTQAIFSIPTPYVLVFAGKIENAVPWEDLLRKLHEKYKNVYIVSADKEGSKNILAKESILIGDITMIKTAARVWPTVMIMNGASIMQKKSYIDYLDK